MIVETTAVAAAIAAGGVALVEIIKALYGRNQNKKDQHEHEENLVKLGASMNGMIEKFDEINKELREMHGEISEFRSEQKFVNQSLLRHDITATYEAFKDKEEMPKVIYESTMSLYDNYKKCGGNSFIDDEVEQMKKWNKV